MHPKLILVTGSTDGIGKQTARELLRLGHRVIVHGRSEAKVAACAEELLREQPGALVERWACDLSRLGEVRARGEELLARFPRLDVLLHNAGVYAQSHTMVEGFELTLAVSHLAPFVLAHALRPALEAAAPSRVVMVSSQVHVRAQLALDDLMMLRGYSAYRAYAQSKLCNVLFANGLAARFPATLITANSLHPGVVGTKLLREGFGMADGHDSLADGAQTSVHLAISPEVEGVTGRYFSRCREATPSPLAHDVELREKLWAASEALTGARWPAAR